MASLSPEQWKEHIVYLTRERPKTSINGVGGYLAKIIEPFDLEEVKTAYGGQEFSYIMKKKNDIVYSGRFTIEAPARLDPQREQATVPVAAPAVAASDVNGVVNQVMTLLREELNHARESGQGSTGANEATVQMLSSASEKAMAILEKQVPQAGNPASTLRELVVALKEMGVMGAQQQGSPLVQLVKELAPLLTLIGPVVEKLLKPADPVAQLTQLKTLMDLADGLRGGGGGSRGTTTNDLILEGIKTLPAMIGDLQAQKAQQRVQRIASPVAPSPGAAPPAARTPLSAPPAAPANQTFPGAAPMATRPLTVTPVNPSQEETAADVGAPTMPAQPGEMPQPTPDEFNTWVSARVVEMIYLGFEGEDIVTWLEMTKPALLEDLTKYTDEQIEGLFSMDPILSRALQHPNWKRILMQARAAAAETLADVDEDEEEIPEPQKVN